jgi:hypothetical protein
MSAVSVVVLPGRYKARELTSVSFLGPILEKTALEIMLANKPVAVTTTYQLPPRYRNFDKAEKPLLKDEVKKHISLFAEDSLSKAFGMIFRKDKEVPNIVKEVKRDKAYIRNSSEISGPVAEREVIYKPKKPRLPSWITTKVSFILELEFSVSSQGDVKEVVPVVSSGNPEVDLLGIRYLKGWKFAPLTQGVREEERSRIKIMFMQDDKIL